MTVGGVDWGAQVSGEFSQIVLFNQHSSLGTLMSEISVSSPPNWEETGFVSTACCPGSKFQQGSECNMEGKVGTWGPTAQPPVLVLSRAGCGLGARRFLV